MSGSITNRAALPCRTNDFWIALLKEWAAGPRVAAAGITSPQAWFFPIYSNRFVPAIEHVRQTKGRSFGAALAI